MRVKLINIIGLIALGVGSRLFPHPPNMTAISAIALKSRSRFGTLGLAIPLTSMILSDALIGFYDWKLLISVYISFALISVLGAFVKSDASITRIGAVSALGSTFFFLITNTVVWTSSSWYAHDAAGLLACLAAGIPFYRNMLIGDILAGIALYRLPQILTRGYTGISKRTFLEPVASLV